MVFLLFLAMLLISEPGDGVEKCHIKGTVTSSLTGYPVQRAEVLLGKDGKFITGTVTDEQGGFDIEVLPGEYQLSASKNGYLGSERRAGGGTRVRLKVAAGQALSDVVIRLAPSCVLSGQVLNDLGEPLEGVEVRAMRHRYQRGAQVFVDTGERVHTNDLGQYRLYGLEPGRYHVCASPPRRTSAEPVRVAERFVTTCYPRASAIAGAADVQVTPGAQISGITIRLVRTHVVTVSGRVSLPEGKEGDVLISLTSEGIGEGASTIAKSGDGNFELKQIPVGSYVLQAHAAENSNVSGYARIDVGEVDLDNIRVTLGDTKVKGRIRVDGTKLIDFSGLGADLARRDSAAMSAGHVGKDGVFWVNTWGPYAYEFAVDGLPASFYLKSAWMGDVNVLKAGLDLAQSNPTKEDLEVVLGCDGGQIDGLVLNDRQEAVSGITVVLVPRLPRKLYSHLYRASTTDQNGAYTIESIAPGQYRILVLEAPEPDIWFDAEFLDKYEKSGESVIVAENDRVVLNLRLDQQGQGSSGSKYR